MKRFGMKRAVAIVMVMAACTQSPTTPPISSLEVKENQCRALIMQRYKTDSRGVKDSLTKYYGFLHADASTADSIMVLCIGHGGEMPSSWK